MEKEKKKKKASFFKFYPTRLLKRDPLSSSTTMEIVLSNASPSNRAWNPIEDRCSIGISDDVADENLSRGTARETSSGISDRQMDESPSPTYLPSSCPSYLPDTREFVSIRTSFFLRKKGRGSLWKQANSRIYESSEEEGGEMDGREDSNLSLPISRKEIS